MRKELLLFLLLISSYFLTAQKKYSQMEIDSFVEQQLNYKNLEEYRQMLLTDKKLKGWSKYYSMYGYHFWTNNQNQYARAYADSAIRNFQSSKRKYRIDENSLLQAFLTLGYIDRTEENYELSTQNFIKALEVEKKYPYKYKSYINAGIANNHLSLGNNLKALEAYQKILKDSTYRSVPQAHVVTLTRLGILYTTNYLNIQDSAYYYLKASEEMSYLKKYTDNLPFIYSNLGVVFKETNLDSALFYFKKSKAFYASYEISENISPSNSDLTILVNNSFVDIYEGKNNRAIKNLKLVISKLSGNLNNKNDRDIIINAYEYIILAFEQSGNLKGANKYLKKKEEVIDIFHETELASQVEKLQVAYETEEKEELINKLALENQNKDLTASKQRIQFILGLTIISALLLTSFVFFRQKNLKSQINKIALEQRLLRSQMNPHFVFNILQSVATLISSTPKKAQKMIVEFGGLLRLSLENSRADFVELRDELRALQKYLQLYANAVFPFEYHIEIDPKLKIDEITIPPMLMQPLVENAIKHGISSRKKNSGRVLVKLSKSNEKFIQCQVKDNGKGFDNPINKRKSLALQILRERLQSYKPTKKVSALSISNKAEGLTNMTTVTIQIPFRYV